MKYQDLIQIAVKKVQFKKEMLEAVKGHSDLEYGIGLSIETLKTHIADLKALSAAYDSTEDLKYAVSKVCLFDSDYEHMERLNNLSCKAEVAIFFSA